VSISPATRYELYHDWSKALTFCRPLPNVAPARPVTFHVRWRQRRQGFWRRVRHDPAAEVRVTPLEYSPQHAVVVVEGQRAKQIAVPPHRVVPLPVDLQRPEARIDERLVEIGVLTQPSAAAAGA
jgi:hypothetical protein